MLRVAIDGKWTAMEFAEFFSALSVLYFLPLPPGEVELQWTSENEGLSWTAGGEPLVWTTQSSAADQLAVLGISFSSPGWVDLAGLGSIMEQLRLLIQYACERRARVNSIELDNEEKRVRIEYMRHLIDMGAQEIPLKWRQILEAEEQPLLDLIAQRKITGASEPYKD